MILLNSVTPFIFPGVIHLFLGNAAIGYLETLITRKVIQKEIFPFPLILANYCSAFLADPIASEISAKFDLNMILNYYDDPKIYPSILFFFTITFLFSIIIEFPFYMWVIKGVKPYMAQVIKANIISNFISYAVIISIYMFYRFCVGE